MLEHMDRDMLKLLGSPSSPTVGQVRLLSLFVSVVPMCKSPVESFVGTALAGQAVLVSAVAGFVPFTRTWCGSWRFETRQLAR